MMVTSGQTFHRKTIITKNIYKLNLVNNKFNKSIVKNG